MTFLENTEDGILSGSDPLLSRFPLRNDATRAQNPAGKVITTIAPAAQRAAYRGLGSRRGVVAAIEPSTGRILALVSTPSYDPGELSGTGKAVTHAWERLNGAADKPMLNRADPQTYPPGSTFKVVTAAAALDAGAVTDLDNVHHLPGPVPAARHHDPADERERGLRGRLAAVRLRAGPGNTRSSPKLGVDVGLRRMTRTATDFGFNDHLRIPFFVAPSNFDTTLDKAQLALSSIGQFNTRATPLQMAMISAAVAGGGSSKRPIWWRRRPPGTTARCRRPVPARSTRR